MRPQELFRWACITLLTGLSICGLIGTAESILPWDGWTAIISLAFGVAFSCLPLVLVRQLLLRRDDQFCTSVAALVALAFIGGVGWLRMVSGLEAWFLAYRDRFVPSQSGALETVLMLALVAAYHLTPFVLGRWLYRALVRCFRAWFVEPLEVAPLAAHAR